MASKNTARTESLEIPIKTSRAWPPDLSALSGIGFDSVSVSGGQATIRKVQSAYMAGRPHLFCEIILSKSSAKATYSVPREHDASLRQLQAAALLLRVLTLLPSSEAKVSQIAAVLLPALESSSHAASLDYGLLSKKYSDLRKESTELSAANLRLSSASEEAASAVLELERQLSALESRIKKLEAVSDESLREMVLDYLLQHRGNFNAASFSASAGVLPARAEEGLEMLLRSGAIRRVGGSFSVHSQESHGQFAKQEKNILSSLSERAKKFAAGAKPPI